MLAWVRVLVAGDEVVIASASRGRVARAGLRRPAFGAPGRRAEKVQMRNADPSPAGQVLAAVEAAAARGRRWSTAAIVAREASLPHQAVEDALADLARRGALSRGLPGDGSPTHYCLAVKRGAAE